MMPTPAPAPRPERRRLLSAIAIILVLAVVAVAFFDLRRDHIALQARVDDALQAARAADQQAADAVREAQRRVASLQEEIESLKNQRAAIDQLYQDLTRGRDEAALLEVDRLVTLASQELQIMGNVASALAALQAADARLARLDRPQLVALRRAIGRDIDRLRALPVVDVTGIALRIDQLIHGVDGWVMLAEPTARPDKKSEARRAEGVDGKESTWNRVRDWLSAEFGDLVRVREVATPEALLLTDAQQRLLRQQLRLRLMEARLALLSRNDRLYRADLGEAQALLTRYFDTRQSGTAAAVVQINQLVQSPVVIDVPQLGESLAAVRELRGGARP